MKHIYFQKAQCSDCHRLFQKRPWRLCCLCCQGVKRHQTRFLSRVFLKCCISAEETVQLRLHINTTAAPHCGCTTGRPHESDTHLNKGIRIKRSGGHGQRAWPPGGGAGGRPHQTIYWCRHFQKLFGTTVLALGRSRFSVKAEEGRRRCGGETLAGCFLPDLLVSNMSPGLQTDSCYQWLSGRLMRWRACGWSAGWRPSTRTTTETHCGLAASRDQLQQFLIPF